MGEETFRHAVIISDPHVHFWPSFSQGSGALGTRFNRTLGVLEKSLDKARELDCPWICAGDWIHTIGWVNNPVINWLIKLLRSYPDVEMYHVWSNHGARSKGEQIGAEESVELLLSAAIPNLRLLNRTRMITKNGLTIYGEGYQPEFGMLKISDPNYAMTRADIGVFHQVVNGSKLATGFEMDNKLSGIPKEALFTLFRLSVAGDIHHPQVFEDDGQLILVPGSPEHHNFGDKGEHGWWIAVFGPDDVQVQMVPSESPLFLTVETAAKVKSDGNFYRVSGPCDPRDLPENATVISAGPTLVEQRNVLRVGQSLRETLESWLVAQPPVFTGVEPISNDKLIDAGMLLIGQDTPTKIRDVEVLLVSMNNFMCYADQHFEVEKGVFLVSGQAKDFNSNGAGKTTLFEALFWCLFGRTTKGVAADDVIMRGQDKCEVIVTLVDMQSSEIVTINRSRTKGGTANLEIMSGVTELKPWHSSKTLDLTRTLQKYLGITPELFQALAYFSQSKLVLFSQASDAERKVMLADLCGLDSYQNAFVQAQKAAKETRKEVDLKDNSRSMLTASVRELEESLQHTLDEASAWEITAQKIRVEAANKAQEQGVIIQGFESLEKNKIQDIGLHEFNRLSRVNTRRDVEIELKHRSILSEKIQVEKDRDEKIRALGVVPLDRTLADQKLKDIEVELQETGDKAAESQIAYQMALHSIVDLEKKLDYVRGVKPNCPTCNQPVDISWVGEQIKRNEEELVTIKSNSTKFFSECGKALEHQKDLRIIIQTAKAVFSKYDLADQIRFEADQRLKGLVDKASDIVENVDAVLEPLRKIITTRMANRRSRVRRYIQTETNKAESLRNLWDSRYKENQADKNPHLAGLARSRQLLDLKTAELEKIRTEHARLLQLYKTYEYWVEGFGRGGIQSLLMDEIAGAFNEARQLVFPTLTRGIYDVQFSTTSSTASGEGREKTAFIIRDRGALLEYEGLSGGQRRRIDLGVMLSLSLAVSKTRGIKGVLGLLVLDEVFGFLDQDGVEALYETLEEIGKFIPSIYAVTHNPNLSSLFRRTLLVKQNPHGVSTIEG